jgi:phage tail-like protein
VSDPFTALHFRVEIMLPGATEPLCEAGFADCDGIELRFDVATLAEGGVNAGRRLLAGPASTGRVTLRRGMTSSSDLWDWCESVQRDPGLRADARVVILAPDGAEQAAFRLRRCLPVRLRAPRLDALHGVVAVEELELACEALVLERPGRDPVLDPPRLEKAELRALDERFAKEIDKERWVRVQLNPRDLRLTHADPESEGPARLALELWFGAGEQDDVRRLTERVAYFAMGSPPVRFVWGTFRFDGHVEALEERLDLFAPDGRALRAQLLLSLRGSASSGR